MGNHKLENFVRIFCVPCFLISVSILRLEMLRVIIQGKFSLGLNFLEDISAGRLFLRRSGTRFPGIS